MAQNWIDLGGRDIPAPILGRDPHTAGSFLLTSQAAQGDEAVPTKGCNSQPTCGVAQDQVVRVAPTMARGTAPKHQLLSAPTLLPPRSLPVPRGQPQMARRGLPRRADLASAAIPPSPSAESVRHKQKDVRMEGNRTLNSTLPVSSSAFDGLRSPTGSHSDGTEPLPPSITSTPLGLGGPRQWQTMSDESRHSMASIYTSPNFNLPGYPAVAPSNLTPTVPSLAGFHHVSSTWPPSMFTSGPSSPHLTTDQANSIFKLAAECQALGIKLAKEFQVLSGLEAMHHNSIQGTVHETLTLGRSAQEAAYSAILRDGVSEAECEATTCHLCSEADATWKEMHEVMYNHQLQYDQQLSTFLMDMEMTLNNMRGEIWATIRTLAENEGIMFDACLGLTLQVLNLLLQIPIDISFQTQIPLTITYCPESSIYRRWHPAQGGVSPLPKEVRASRTLSKVLGRVTHQPSEGVDHPPSPATSGGSQGSRHRSCSRARSITPARSR